MSWSVRTVRLLYSNRLLALMKAWRRTRCPLFGYPQFD